MVIIFAKRRGDSIYLCVPAHIARKFEIKNLHAFKFERDVMLPDNYSLIKIDNNE